MTLTTILIFGAAILFYRLIFQSRARGMVLLIVSTLAVYWLQPAMPVRNLDFWLPTATLALVVLSWVVTTPPAGRSWRTNWQAFAALGVVVLVVALTRYLSLTGGIVIPSRPPQTDEVLLALALIGLACWLLMRVKRVVPALLAGGMVLLVGLLVVIKQPELAKGASAGLRSLAGQDAALAASTDIRWLGYSYLAFRLIHTLRDRQTGRLPAVTLQEYVNYAIFFPAFTAGPIDRLERFVKDLRAGSLLTGEDFTEGGLRLVVGLFKKFVLADSLAIFALSATNAGQVRSAGWTWVLVFAYTFQIYLDFSGYTDIALGLARWLGFRLPENFNHPYLKPNLTQFWNNWHMTLTQWVRAYYFNPLARALRSAKKPLPAWMALFISQVSTMLVIGLWHGITWNFLIWGAWHGLGLFVHNRWSELLRPWQTTLERHPRWKLVGTGVSTAFTFVYVALGWVWFCLPTPVLALQVFGKLFGG
ncbi:MAG: MBOAT family O-acyltransferase [Anaerolineaceae bacterium]|jgi:D-alanyl-lipoteichoic acid acyltransferase DltB (MBOAT superfamily)